MLILVVEELFLLQKILVHFTDYVFGDGMISALTSGAVADGSWGTIAISRFRSS